VQKLVNAYIAHERRVVIFQTNLIKSSQATPEISLRLLGTAVRCKKGCEKRLSVSCHRSARPLL
jgi:hypothetical protein